MSSSGGNVAIIATQRAKKWPPIRTSLMAIIVAFGSSFSFGFQLLITNPAQGAFIKVSFYY